MQQVTSLHLEMLEHARQCGEDVAGTIQVAAERADAPHLTRLFSEHAIALGTATQRLATALMKLGKRPDEGSTVLARFERAALAFRSHLPRSDERLLQQCVQLERATGGAMGEAVSLPWPDDIRPSIDAAYATARRCIREIERARVAN